MTTPPPTPPPTPPTPDAYSGDTPNEDDKTMAMVAHFGMIIFGFIPPLIIYLVKSDSPWAKREAAKAFNFVVIAAIADIALFILGIIFGVIGLGALSCIITLGYLAIWVAVVVFGIQNGLRANNGEETKYPVEIPILK